MTSMWKRGTRSCYGYASRAVCLSNLRVVESMRIERSQLSRSGSQLMA